MIQLPVRKELVDERVRTIFICDVQDRNIIVDLIAPATLFMFVGFVARRKKRRVPLLRR
jgi:hypothetical protein